MADFSIASWGPNRLDMFVVGRDRHIWHTSWDGNAWQDAWDNRGAPPAPPGGAFDVSAVSWGPNRLDVFAGDFHVWHNSSNNGYTFFLNDYHNNQIRSNHKDTLFAACMLQVGNQIVGPQTAFVGEADYPLFHFFPPDLRFDSVLIGDPDTIIRFTFQLVNAGAFRGDIHAKLRETTHSLAELLAGVGFLLQPGGQGAWPIIRNARARSGYCRSSVSRPLELPQQWMRWRCGSGSDLSTADRF